MPKKDSTYQPDKSKIWVFTCEKVFAPLCTESEPISHYFPWTTLLCFRITYELENVRKQIACSAIFFFLKYFICTNLFCLLPHGPFSASAFFAVGNGWYLEKWDILILLILIKRAWIILMVQSFDGPLQNTHHSSVWMACIYSFCSISGRKLCYLGFMDWKSMDHCQNSA